MIDIDIYLSAGGWTSFNTQIVISLIIIDVKVNLQHINVLSQ